MNILLAHFRVGETDGVSLEMDKWKWALESLGHRVIYLAGSSGGCDAEIIPELHYSEAFNNHILYNAYVERVDYISEIELMAAIERRAHIIADQIELYIGKHDIDIVIPNNIWSLGYHLSAALGLMRAIEKTQTPVICHHHDFHWERIKYSKPTSPGITKILQTICPPNHELVEHCVINHIAQAELKKRRNIDSVVVPNVFDFHESDWKIEEYNQDLRVRFNIKENDIVFLQATRIVARKGIELAIDLIEKLATRRKTLIGKGLYNGQVFTSDSRLILTFAGICEDASYLSLLKEKAKSLDVELLFVNEYVGHSRGINNDEKVYSLWDVYSHADIITYPSLLEGWGNQFLEGLVARVPMVVYRYPVYDLDIANFDFDIIDLGNTHTVAKNGLAEIPVAQLEQAVDQTISYLFDIEKRKTSVNRNHQIGQDHLSYPILKNTLAGILEKHG